MTWHIALQSFTLPLLLTVNSFWTRSVNTGSSTEWLRPSMFVDRRRLPTIFERFLPSRLTRRKDTGPVAFFSQFHDMHLATLFALPAVFALVSSSIKEAFPSNMVKIAVLGGGSVGATLAKALLDNGMDVLIAARDPDKTLSKLKESNLGDLAVGPTEESIKSADVLILATPGIVDDAGIQAFAASLGDVSGKVIIDATNPLGPFQEGLNVRWDKETSSGEVLAAALPSAKVYKSFNTVGVEHMKYALGKDMMLAGDPDEASRKIAEEVVAGVGFKPFYVGPIRYARNLEAIAELWIHMAVPPLGARTTTRRFWFSISGDP